MGGRIEPKGPSAAGLQRITRCASQSAWRITSLNQHWLSSWVLDLLSTKNSHQFHNYSRRFFSYPEHTKQVTAYECCRVNALIAARGSHPTSNTVTLFSSQVSCIPTVAYGAGHDHSTLLIFITRTLPREDTAVDYNNINYCNCHEAGRSKLFDDVFILIIQLYTKLLRAIWQLYLVSFFANY